EVSVLREGGGLINLPRALNPLLFAAPTGITFPVDGGPSTVALTDAGGGAGAWSAKVVLQGTPTGVAVEAPVSVTVPGALKVTAAVGAAAQSGPVTGFVVLTHGADTRRVPFLVVVDHPVLETEPVTALTHPGIYDGTTKGGASKIVRYRYPT